MALDLVPLLPLHPTEILPPEVRAAPRDRLRILDQEEAAAYKAAGFFGFSPSQVDEFRMCPRKWAFKQIEKIYEPSGAGAALGTECHGVWEEYLRSGALPPTGTLIGKITGATLRYLPLPKIATVEGETKLWTPLGIMTARIDFWIPDQGAHSRAELGEMPEPWNAEKDSAFAGVPLIGDHKTTSNFDYAKHPEDLIGDGTRELAGDAQASAYGAVAWVRTLAEKIDLFWSYSRTKGSKGALPIRARHTLSTLDPALTYLFEDVATMRLFRETKKSANDVPANPAACDAFGGCPHRKRCNLTPEERDRSIMMTLGNNDDLASLLGIGAAPSAPSAPSTLSSTAKPAPAPVAAPAGDDLAASLGIGAPASTPVKAAPITAAPAAPPADDLSSLLGVSAPAPTPPPAAAPNTEQAAKLAAHFFQNGKPLPETANAEVKAAYAKLLAAAQPNPPDAPPATVSTPAPAAAPPAPPAATAPAAITSAPKADDLAALVGGNVTTVDPIPTEAPKKGRKPRVSVVKAEGSSDLSSVSSIELMQEVLQRNLEAKNFKVVAALSTLLAETQIEA